jgi:hypothetical protein
MLNVVETSLTLLGFGENRARNKVRPIVTFQVRIAEFQVTHSGGTDANKGWSVDSVFAGRATLEAGVDYRKGFAGGDGQHSARPPPAFTHTDDPDPDGGTWTKLADPMNIH